MNTIANAGPIGLTLELSGGEAVRLERDVRPRPPQRALTHGYNPSLVVVIVVTLVRIVVGV